MLLHAEPIFHRSHLTIYDSLVFILRKFANCMHFDSAASRLLAMSANDTEQEDSVLPHPTLIDDNKGLHPLFWDALPEDAEEDPAYAGIQALQEELTPEEKAESFKVLLRNHTRKLSPSRSHSTHNRNPNA